MRKYIFYYYNMLSASANSSQFMTILMNLKSN